jgi:SAM-dependent methyltransferase
MKNKTKSTRPKVNKKVKNKTLKYNTTYGEMEISGIEKLYNYLKTTNSFNCFMDLGSGKGKVCMYMAKQPDIKQVVGIELVEERHEEANQLMKTLNTDDAQKVSLHLDDIFNVSLKKYNTMNTFIWISSLCFPQDVVNNIFKKIKKELKEGTIVCCSKTPTVNIGELIGTLTVPQTWNKDHLVSIYKM